METQTWDAKVNEITKHLKGKELEGVFDESDAFYTQMYEYLTVDREIELSPDQVKEIKFACQQMKKKPAHEADTTL